MKLEFSSERFDLAQRWLFAPSHIIVPNAANMLGVCRRRIYQLYESGKLNGGKVDGILYISVESIQMRVISREANRGGLHYQGVCRQERMAFK